MFVSDWAGPSCIERAISRRRSSWADEDDARQGRRQRVGGFEQDGGGTTRAARGLARHDLERVEVHRPSALATAATASR